LRSRVTRQVFDVFRGGETGHDSGVEEVTGPAHLSKASGGD